MFELSCEMYVKYQFSMGSFSQSRTSYEINIQQLGADHLIRGGLWFFLRDQTSFFDSQLKCTIFFRPYQKQTIFFSAVNAKQFFSHLFHLILRTPVQVLDMSPHLPELSTMSFDKESYCAIVWNM